MIKPVLGSGAPMPTTNRPILPALTLTSPPYISIEPFAYRPSSQPYSESAIVVSIFTAASITFMVYKAMAAPP